MRAALSVKWRNRLRKAERQHIHVTQRPMPSDPTHWLFRAEAQSARLKGYRPFPPALVVAMARARPDSTHLFTAYGASGRLGAMLFLRHGWTATYQIGWISAEGRALSAGNLLMWQAMEALQRLGVGQIDLGAADTLQDPGLTRFKLGTGARLRTLGGTWLDSAALSTLRRFL